MKCVTILFFCYLSFGFSQGYSQIPNYVPQNGLIGWWPFNGNANDESGNGNHGKVNGAILVQDRFGNPESAYGFSGINDNILIDTTFFNNGWESFTFSCWVYLNESANPRNINSSHVFLNTIPHHGLGVGYNWRNSKRYAFSVGDGTPANRWNTNLFEARGNSVFDIKTWKHIALVKSKRTYTMYVDGIKEISYDLTNDIQSYYYKLLFGSGDQGITNEALDGRLDEPAIWNRALDSNEIKRLFNNESSLCSYVIKESDTTICQGNTLELHTSNDFHLDSIPKEGLIGYWPFNGNANDESGNGNHGIVDKATLTSDKNNKPNSAYQFYKSGSKIAIPDAKILNNPFVSISFWLKTQDTLLQSYIYKSQEGTANHEEYGIVSNFTRENTLEFSIKNGSNCIPSSGWKRNIKDIVVFDGNWHHITATYDGIFSRMYVDTVLVSEIQDAFFPIDSCPGGEILFGKGWNNDANYDGVLDDIAIWNRAISPAEVKTMYMLNRPKKSLGLPTDGLIGFWPFNGNAQDQSSLANHGEVNGATLTTDRCDKRNSAYEFNGIDNFIEVKDSESLSNMNSITMSAWIFLDNDSKPFQGILTKWWQGVNCTDNSDNYCMAINNVPQTNNEAKFVCGTNNYTNYQLQSTVKVNTGNWMHLSFVHDKTVGGKLFINGVFAGSTDIPGEICKSTNPLLIGADNNRGTYWRFFDGKIDDLAIWNRALSDSEIIEVYNAGSCNCLDTLSEDKFKWSTGEKGRKITVSPNTSTMYTLEVNRGQIIDRDTIHVTVLESPKPDIFGHVKVYERQVNYSYYTQLNDSSTYEWTITGNGKLSSTNGGSSILVDFKEPGYAYLTVTETNKYGCKKDTTITIRIYGITDINESEKNSQMLTIYPNPINEFNSLNVQAFLPPSSRSYLTITNMLGKTLETIELGNNDSYSEIKIPLSTEGLSNGVYMIQLHINGEYISRTLIINR